MMDVFNRRRSVRKFKPDPIPQAILDRLLEAATAAPSAGNCQPWHFYAIRSASVKSALCRCAHQQKFIEDAPLAVVVCAEPTRSAKRYAHRGETLYVFQDTAAATQNILLCAVQNGLDACWCGAFDEAEAALALDLPQALRPVAILAIGYAQGESKKPPRRPMSEVVTFLD